MIHHHWFTQKLCCVLWVSIKNSWRRPMMTGDELFFCNYNSHNKKTAIHSTMSFIISHHHHYEYNHVMRCFISHEIYRRKISNFSLFLVYSIFFFWVKFKTLNSLSTRLSSRFKSMMLPGRNEANWNLLLIPSISQNQRKIIAFAKMLITSSLNIQILVDVCEIARLITLFIDGFSSIFLYILLPLTDVDEEALHLHRSDETKNYPW